MNVLKSRKELLTLGYGNRNLNGKPYNHTGLDFVKEGYQLDDIISGAKGKVIALRNTVVGVDHSAGYGNYIKLEHGDGYQTLYAHLKQNSLKVKVGDIVEEGTVIGSMGNTGYVTGAHLHFEVRLNGKCVDPTQYMNESKQIKDFGVMETNQEDIIYKVIAGDTLSEIASKYGTTYQCLSQINNIVDPNKIYVNQEIRIPVKNHSDKYKVIATRGLNCRKGVGINYSVVKAYKHGTVIEIGKIQNGWGKTNEGYVCMEYVNKI